MKGYPKDFLKSWSARDAAPRVDAATGAASPSSKALIRRRVWVVLNPEAAMAMDSAWAHIDEADDHAEWRCRNEPWPVVMAHIEYQRPTRRKRG